MPFAHPKLKAEVNKMSYDFTRRVGFIHMAPYSCTDMTGATAIFEAIDPRVLMIVTFAGEKLDTTYVKAGQNKERMTWGALAPNGAELSFDPEQLDEAEAREAIRALRALPEVRDMPVSA